VDAAIRVRAHKLDGNVHEAQWPDRGGRAGQRQGGVGLIGVEAEAAAGEAIGEEGGLNGGDVHGRAGGCRNSRGLIGLAHVRGCCGQPQEFEDRCFRDILCDGGFCGGDAAGGGHKIACGRGSIVEHDRDDGAGQFEAGDAAGRTGSWRSHPANAGGVDVEGERQQFAGLEVGELQVEHGITAVAGGLIGVGAQPHAGIAIDGEGLGHRIAGKAVGVEEQILKAGGAQIDYDLLDALPVR